MNFVDGRWLVKPSGGFPIRVKPANLRRIYEVPSEYLEGGLSRWSFPCEWCGVKFCNGRALGTHEWLFHEEELQKRQQEEDVYLGNNVRPPQVFGLPLVVDVD